MPTLLNVEMPHGISEKVVRIFISVTVGAPGTWRYSKVTLPTAAFPDLLVLPRPLPPEMLKGFMKTTEDREFTEEVLQGVPQEVSEC